MNSGTETASDASSGGIFQRTRWSVVIEARDTQSPRNRQAMEEFCHLYWKPIYLFIRGKGHPPHEAEDLTQEFLFRLIDGRYLRGVEGPEKGRLRSFLSVCLKRFLIDMHRMKTAEKRPEGGGRERVLVDGPAAESAFAQSWNGDAPPEREFDRHWAMELLAQVFVNLRAKYESEGKAELFEALKSTVSLSEDSLPYARLAAQLGKSEGAVKVAVHRLRENYRQILRGSLAETVEDPAEIDGELRYLLSLFARN